MAATDSGRTRKRKIFYIFLLLLMFFLIWRMGSRIRRENKVEDRGSQEEAVATKNINGELIVATTTSLEDSGLLEALVPVFEKKSGLKIKVIAVGTGEALEMGRRQVADLLLVHAPDLESRFMEEGFGLRREEFMASDMVIAGPASDEASLRGKSLTEAFSGIASARHPFVSRADKSGTHHLEMKIWEASGINPSGDWYLQTGQGMAESLRIASEKQAYILTDYPTFRKVRAGLNLEILTRDEQHKNIYSAISVRDLTGKINTTGAEALVNFLISEKAQKIIAEFGRTRPEDEPLFAALRLGRAKPIGE
ncbi:MAG: substrate-binding domain-containing protein [Candidatus Saccharicenans sp.]|uniref:substrate-binding domain-containing protein n=1 Tax=Candidatus Saccharicenans sp. TaxID=2819258 RepID=UPI004049D3F5